MTTQQRQKYDITPKGAQGVPNEVHEPLHHLLIQ